MQIHYPQQRLLSMCPAIGKTGSGKEALQETSNKGLKKGTEGFIIEQ